MLRPSTWLIFLLCTALLLVRGVDVHVHLCFDGQEPASSIHYENGAALAEHSTVPVLSHNDLNVYVSSDVAHQSPKLAVPLIASFIVALFMALARLPKSLPALSRAMRFRAVSRPYFMPPLRGPPLLLVR